MQRVRQAVVNGLRQMGMLDGALERMDGPVTTVRGHTWVKLTGPRGLTFMAKEKRGQMVSAGEVIGYVKHPFTGDNRARVSGGAGRADGACRRFLAHCA